MLRPIIAIAGAGLVLPSPGDPGVLGANRIDMVTTAANEHLSKQAKRAACRGVDSESKLVGNVTKRLVGG